MVTPPSYRFDIEIEEDLIEEVARVYGFERIPAEPPWRARPCAASRRDRGPCTLCGLCWPPADYQEVINFSFVEPDWEADFAGCADPIRLLNPIASQLSVMRTSLFAGLVANVRYNVNRKATRVRVFEVGRVFLRQPEAGEDALDVAGIRQPVRLGAAAFGPAADEQWGVAPRGADFYDVKGDLEGLLAPLTARFEPATHPALHPGRCARVVLDGQAIGWVGELHPRWQQKYELPAPVVLFEVEAAPVQRCRSPPTGRCPAFRRSPGTSPSRLPRQSGCRLCLMICMAHRPPQVETIRLFDHYRGSGVEIGKKSLAFRVLLQDTQKTMTDAEVDAAMQQVRQRLRESSVVSSVNSGQIKRCLEVCP